MAQEYQQDILEPELKPEYIKKAKERMKEKPVKVGTSKDLRKMMGLK